MADLTYAEGLAESLPVCDDTDEGTDLISLCDIVITGIETPWGGGHFKVVDYKPDNDGVEKPWASLIALKAAMPSKSGKRSISLTATTVRWAVKDYLQSRLDSGMSPREAAHLIDGSYTDAVIADSILQFALYGEEVFG